MRIRDIPIKDDIGNSDHCMYPDKDDITGDGGTTFLEQEWGG